MDVSRNMIRIGFLQFSDNATTGIRFNLDNNFNATTISEIFTDMTWIGGTKTLTNLALEKVAKEVRIYL